MFFFFSKILDLAFSPLTWAILLCAGAAVGSRPGHARAGPALAVLLLTGFSMEPVSNRLMHWAEADAKRTMRDGTTYDVVVLLGGLMDHRATATTHEPSYNEGAERLLSTYDLLRTGRARHAILSGGPDDDDDAVVEATELSRQLEAWGIAKDRLITEGASRNTRENATFSARLIHERRFTTVLLVTSAAHVPRAVEAFRAEGVEADALPVDFRSFDPERASSRWLPRAACLSTSTTALRELAGRVVYRILGMGRS